jgi:hypothetical protein
MWFAEYGEIKSTITQNQRAAKNHVDRKKLKNLLGATETFIAVSNHHRLKLGECGRS